MSLLADLLSKIKQPQTTREVPPNLKHIVQSSASKSATRRKIVILSGLVFVLVLTGVVIVYLVNTVSETSDIGIVPQQHAANVNQNTDNQGGQAADNKNKAAEHLDPPKKTATPAASVNVKKKKIPAKKQKPRISASASSIVTSSVKESEDYQTHAVKEIKEIDIAARDALLYKAREFEMKQDYSSALGIYKEVLEMESDNVMVLNNVAYIYLKLGLVQESIQYARMAEELDVDYTPALINLGIAYAESSNVTAAEYYLDRAFKLEPDNKNAIFNLALLNETKQNYSGAAGYFTKLIKLGDTAGTLGLARVYQKQGINAEAVKLYKKASLLESLDKQQRIQIRQRIIALQNEVKRADALRPAVPATGSTQ